MMNKGVENFRNNEELTSIFKENGVIFAYLFGSRVSDGVNDKSDIDIAAMLPTSTSKEERFENRLKMMGEISKIFKKDIDLIILNDAKSLFFKYIIMKEGKIIYQENEMSAVDFEIKTLGMYFDFRPFLEAYNKSYVKRSLQ